MYTSPGNLAIHQTTKIATQNVIIKFAQLSTMVGLVSIGARPQLHYSSHTHIPHNSLRNQGPPQTYNVHAH